MIVILYYIVELLKMIYQGILAIYILDFTLIVITVEYEKDFYRVC